MYTALRVSLSASARCCCCNRPETALSAPSSFSSASFNRHFWVYTGPATDAQLTLTVIDTATGKVRVYVNPLGTAAGATTDTEAFATCP
jgi:hypothetical protein